MCCALVSFVSNIWLAAQSVGGVSETKRIRLLFGFKVYSFWVHILDRFLVSPRKFPFANFRVLAFHCRLEDFS